MTHASFEAFIEDECLVLKGTPKILMAHIASLNEDICEENGCGSNIESIAYRLSQLDNDEIYEIKIRIK